MSKTSKIVIKKSAEQLSQLSRFSKHGYIDVPHAIIDANEDYKTTYDAVVEPQWNQTLVILKEPSGYGKLLSMLQRLYERYKKTEDRRGVEEQALNQFQMAFRLFRYEGKIYGFEKTISESLGLEQPLNESKPEWWTWGLTTTVTEEDVVVDYDYHPRVTDLFKSSFAANELPAYFVPMDGDQTWRQILESAGRMAELHDRQVTGYRGLLQLTRFRIHVIEAVLHEYELLGYVGRYEKHKKPDALEPDAINEVIENLVALKIVEKGLELYDADDPGKVYNNRASLVDELLNHFNYSSGRGIEKMLARNGCYNTKEKGEAHAGNAEEHLTELIELWRSILKSQKKNKKERSP